MNNASLIRLTGTRVLVAITLSGPIANGHPCERDDSPNHKHCSGDGGSNLGDRIPGIATISPAGIKGSISSDGKGSYEDGVETKDLRNEAALMQVAMNCQFNHFTLNPGGGPGSVGRRIGIDFLNDTGSISTGITSCDVTGGGVPQEEFVVVVDDTSMTDPDCNGDGDPDWAFDQLLRAFADSSGNVCELMPGDGPLMATMRLQTNLHHLTTCKGGAKKCGVKLEAIDINYDQVDITCTMAGSQCTHWTVISISSGELSYESEIGPVMGEEYAVDILFTTETQ